MEDPTRVKLRKRAIVEFHKIAYGLQGLCLSPMMLLKGFRTP